MRAGGRLWKPSGDLMKPKIMLFNEGEEDEVVALCMSRRDAVALYAIVGHTNRKMFSDLYYKLETLLPDITCKMPLHRAVKLKTITTIDVGTLEKELDNVFQKR